MTTNYVQRIIGGENAEVAITEEWSARLVTALGHDWPDERSRGMAATARELNRKGMGNQSLPLAYELELLLHGDDTAPQFVGIANG